ncbi:TetR/AcrR family transcriptional regulator [Roseibium denhamense]|uniref:Transcriptional regulator, TetR family n=1 Tax=Roseibium denhamense TaxID=76305 RepID=A0ABY1NS04_9HYPH|nr:TetR/AcrR family transcriptional regulator [Roseibium denhamense]MTI08150.1 TetR/AcrR family transcriptional regulator [Roseibium denhamense]SMP16720.1 transcriptional regulator, TetR family [Roseibium denhamense]
MTEHLTEKTSGWRGTRDIWLQAAYEALLEHGIDGVKVMPLADRLNLSRTSFYGHFSDRQDLLDALVTLWQSKNTGNLIRRSEDYADSITEAILNIFDLWLVPNLFDSQLEFAVRNWAHTDESLASLLETADCVRIDALQAMFERFGFEAGHANIRANTVYQTQIGYISMRKDGPQEPLAPRLSRMPYYAEIFSGQKVTDAELARFLSRHGGTG